MMAPVLERLPKWVNADAGLARRGRYLLTGEYDFSCTPEDTERTAAKIKGARVTVMREIGHFPMSENPAQFRRYILPVLEEIRAAL
jgi:pimeloyl-ACP methyl ester carboxylesterase